MAINNQAPFVFNGAVSASLEPAISIPGSSSGVLTVATNASTSSYQLIMPASQGGSNTVLQNDGTGALTWQTNGSGGGASFNVTSQTTGYSAAINDYVICSSASFAVLLPTAVSQSGKSIAVQHNGTSLTQLYQITTTSGQTLNGPGGTVTSGNYVLYTNGEVVTFMSDGANWQIRDHKTDTGWVSDGVNLISATSAYVFTVTAANATIGAVYSNNGFLYTVSVTIATGVTLTCSGTGTPTTSGTLTKVSGTGDATITFASRTITGVPVKGTVTNDVVRWRRVGPNMEVRTAYNQTTGGTTGSGDVVLTVPAAQLIDTTQLIIYQIANQQQISNSVGQNYVFNATPGSASGPVVVYSPTLVRFSNGQSGNGTFLGASSAYGLGATNQTITSFYSVPIVGWQP